MAQRPLTVLYVISALPKLGPVNVLEGIIRHLDCGRIRPVIVCLRGRAADGHDAVFAALGVETHYLNRTHWQLELRTADVARRVEGIARRVGAELIHTHGYHPDLIGARLRLGLPRVSTQHNLSDEDFSYAKGRLLGGYMHRRLWRALGSYEVLVGITEEVSRYAKRHAPGVETRTILNGVDTELFAPMAPGERTAIRHTLGITPEAYVWLMCGGLNGRKDPTLVISAFISAYAAGTLPRESHLILIGAGPLMDSCRALARGMEERVHLLGFQSDAHRYVGAADCLITASHSEGFGLNVAEALVSGLSVIASDLAVFAELFAFSPSQAIQTFARGDHHALCQALARAPLAVPTEEETQAFRSGLSAQRMSTEYTELYERLANPSS